MQLRSMSLYPAKEIWGRRPPGGSREPRRRVSIRTGPPQSGTLELVKSVRQRAGDESAQAELTRSGCPTGCLESLALEALRLWAFP